MPDGIDETALRSAFAAQFPDAPRDRVRIVRAPGRVNLIGEHTDYNEGLVLPAAIDLEIRIAFVRDDEPRAELVRLDLGEREAFSLEDPGPPQGSWRDYVAGTAWSLKMAGRAVNGLRGVLASNLPISTGLSSSAALELASAWALLDAVPDRSAEERMELARLAQRAENEYVGVRSGLMDQFASSLGRPDGALLLDCRSLEYRAVALRLPGYSLVVCDTTSPRRLASGEYNVRRAQCEAAVAEIAKVQPGVRSLRDVDLTMLERFGDRLDPISRNRAEHIVRENARVLEAVAAFEAGDLRTIGRVFAESHASLRDLYDVGSPVLDAMVEAALSVPGTAAARMTGAGFGGCTVNIVADSALAGFGDAVLAAYRARTGLPGAVYVVHPAAGAGVVA